MATDDGNPTRLYTDDWMGYNNVSDIGFDHRKGNHSKGFGKATEHSNNIEAHWRVLRSVSGFNKGFYEDTYKNIELSQEQNTKNMLSLKNFIIP